MLFSQICGEPLARANRLKIHGIESIKGPSMDFAFPVKWAGKFPQNLQMKNTENVQTLFKA